jgi:lysophospholipase L1-like esterase
MNHMPRAGSAGFDLFGGAGPAIRYRKTVQPGSGQTEVEMPLVGDLPREMTDWTLYLPLYGTAAKIEIGVAPGSRLEAPTPHAVAKPILFYGSSITQGGCASRPGNAYTTLLCRALDAPQINLGFSGSGKGEPAVAEAIAGLDLAAFVLDYDHNAPSVEHLQATHEKFFDIVRRKNPDLPIVIMSQCDYHGFPVEQERRAMIRRTYENAARNGDRRVWFIDGETLFGTEDREACTVDGCHPNDLGFYRMFRTVLPVLAKALGG